VGRVLFLGAGASITAGYPATSKLLSSLDDDATRSPFVQYVDSWKAWRDYLNAAPAWLRLVLENPNPEVALSLPDLFDIAVAEQDSYRFVDAVRRVEQGDEGVDLEQYYDGPERRALAKARRAKSRLVEALHWYFMFKHGSDRDAGRATRDYLRRQLAPMKPGDVAMTTNWDPLLERTLAEDRRWSLADGYGFPRDLVQLIGYDRRLLPKECTSPSEIPVLKLHGSFGWREIDGQFFLQGDEFLDVFGFYCSGHPIQIRDKNEPESYHPSDPIVAFPSYLKSLSHPILLDVWRAASEAIVNCSDFAAAGYSLPESDSAVRALLLPVANSVRAGRVKAIVVDPSRIALDRWREFLGSNPRYVESTLESAPVLLQT
jgi:hypothetical protein